MARSNTPVSYKCGFCVKLGHNARTCPNRDNGVKSDAQKLKEQRAEKRVIREARKAEKEAKKLARSTPDAIQQEIEQVIADCTPVIIEDERPIVDIPPAISKIGDTTYVVSGSIRVPVPEDTAFDEIAAFVQYIPPVGTRQLSIFSSKWR
jgi:hypothetical protein